MTRFYSLVVALLTLFTVAACAAPTSPPLAAESTLPASLPLTPLAPASPSSIAAPDEPVRVIVIHGERALPVQPAQTVSVTLLFEPALLTRGRTPDGTTYTSIKPIDVSPASEMRFCVQFSQPCTPNGMWSRFDTRYETTLTVDWMGERQVWVGAEFRDPNGRPVPIHYTDEPSAPVGRANVRIRLTSAVDEKTPLAAQPEFVQTGVAATRTAFPVTGSVKIDNSPCCVGGKAGSTVEIHVNFQAASPAGPVTEMRTASRCLSPQDLSSSWEPFVAHKTYTTTAALNWTGWYIAVQYRDANGNLSPVYCDDISVEGMP